ncbi:Presequence protease chloroplastic/mitochondrial-like [Quillaja saponaria]|uniref:Presequence protease chloroplastic/mitochondrial-like n=1 Tax=Quillaja saponaria TaxID=32244 RepID=A0AAD7QAM1_QUISA|nr:Presequence protease chloroplastic/mitochondrial-like [Quillaja saponaria]
MERAALMRSCSSMACNRFSFYSSHKLSRPTSSFIPLVSLFFIFSSNKPPASIIPHSQKFCDTPPMDIGSCIFALVFFLPQEALLFSLHSCHGPPLQLKCLRVQDEVAEKLGFEKVSEEFIGEWKSNAVLFRHKKTGAEVMSVSNDDENKVFAIVFWTPPKDDTGITHILEHSVLRGSRKYPFEDLMELLNGSSYTLQKSMTYHCADDSQTFQQQGWHFELNNPSEDISYEGVVFNKMKEAYSNFDYILDQTAQRDLFPDSMCRFDCGGDPQFIPKLTFEEFKSI